MLVFAGGAMAQMTEPVLFREKIFDFGKITESEGPVEHEFEFYNNTGRQLKVISVKASCGCTTPGWTQEPIATGKPGFVKARFDPRGRPGYFNKSLTVTTDFDGQPIVLQIKGQVVTGEFNAASWPGKSGSLRLKSNSFNLGRLFVNREPITKEFDVYNAGDKAIAITKVMGPPYLKIEAPKSIQPKEYGVIKILYDVAQKKQLGFASDNVELETDDEAQPLKSFSVYSTLEEYFPPLNEIELAKAPVLKPNFLTLDFGRLNQGTDAMQEMLLKNEGKKELSIRAIQSNCTCVTYELDEMTIKPGAEVKLKITLTTQGRKGNQQKALTVYSNDPVNPVQRVTVTAYIQ